MSSSKTAAYCDALAAKTSIEEITEDEQNQETLRLLRDDDARVSRLLICDEILLDGPGDYHPYNSDELGWLGHFAKKSTHLDEFCVSGSNVFDRCSKQSVDRFLEEMGRCSRIKKLVFKARNDLTEILRKLDPAIKNNGITQLAAEECVLTVSEAHLMFDNFRDMKNLEVLSLWFNDFGGGHDLNDGIMAGCVPSLAACTGMRKLDLSSLGLSTDSCDALSAVFPRMASLHELNLYENSIGDNCVQVLVRGLAECKNLQSLNLYRNLVGDSGLDVLIRGLPASVDSLDLRWNQIALTRQVPLLRFKDFYLTGNSLSPGGPGVIAASLANPECRLAASHLYDTTIRDEGAVTLATSMPGNQRLTHVYLDENNITETGWHAFSSVLCDRHNKHQCHPWLKPYT